MDDLMELVVPVTERDVEAVTVGELIHVRALGVEPVGRRDRWLHIYGEGQVDPERIGPFHWGLWVGDEARLCYDDDAEVSVDESLLARPGVQSVEWMDREEFLVGAPTLCASGMLAAAARALADPRLRQRKRTGGSVRS